MSKTIKIPAPTVGYEELCEVLDYRCRPPRWRQAFVTALKYESMFSNEFAWSYSVALVIDGEVDYHQRRYVGDDSIREES